jgi:hypothetical protein
MQQNAVLRPRADADEDTSKMQPNTVLATAQKLVLLTHLRSGAKIRPRMQFEGPTAHSSPRPAKECHVCCNTYTSPQCRYTIFQQDATQCPHTIFLQDATQRRYAILCKTPHTVLVRLPCATHNTHAILQHNTTQRGYVTPATPHPVRHLMQDASHSAGTFPCCNTQYTTRHTAT